MAFEAVYAAVDAAIASGQETGLQIAVFHQGAPVLEICAGLADPVTGRPVTPDTLFNVFSVSKAVTATALHMQVERGLVDYDAPIATYWPEFAQNGKETATVRHALTHRVGVPHMPSGMTPEKMCDWSYMTNAIAALAPLAPPGEKTLYQSMTFGWIIGEIVRRSDPQGRDFSTFIKEELCAPLGIKDLWFGIPPSEAHRVAVLSDRNEGDPVPPDTHLAAAAMPQAVALLPRVFERPDVQQACIPAVGGLFTARAEATFWAMLAEGGTLNGHRFLSRDRVETFTNLRDNGDEVDPVMYGIPVPISVGGYWLGGPKVSGPRALWHPGAGGSIGFADPDRRLAVAICHNRMFNTRDLSQDPILPITRAILAACEKEFAS